MTRPAKGRLAGAILMVALVALVGCTASGDKIGPLGGPGDPGQICNPLRPGQVLSYGFTGIRNSGHSTVMIDRVGLADIRGLKVIAAYVVPGTSRFLYGSAYGYPPVRPLPSGIDWAARQRADGAKLPPMKLSQEDSLLLVIKPIGHRGAASGVDIWYHADGQHYHLKTSTSLVTFDRRACAEPHPVRSSVA